MRLMRAASILDFESLRYPLMASPKINGYRFGRHDGMFMTSGWKPMKNKAIQAAFRHLPDGWDGEITVGVPNDPRCLSRTSSKVTTINGDADEVQVHVFDNFRAAGGFRQRLSTVGAVWRLDHVLVESASAAKDLHTYYEELCYEGMVLRHPDGIYKFGDSTLTEQLMLKVKRFVDDEAFVIGAEELYSNLNEAKLDVQGYTERSSHQANMKPMGVLGALIVDWRGHTLRIGTGFTAEQRKEYWIMHLAGDLVGKLAKFKYLPGGMKDLPNPAVFLAFRDPDDMFKEAV